MYNLRPHTLIHSRLDLFGICSAPYRLGHAKDPMPQTHGKPSLGEALKPLSGTNVDSVTWSQDSASRTLHHPKVPFNKSIFSRNPVYITQIF